jgi:hypothetical protein
MVKEKAFFIVKDQHRRECIARLSNGSLQERLLVDGCLLLAQWRSGDLPFGAEVPFLRSDFTANIRLGLEAIHFLFNSKES